MLAESEVTLASPGWRLRARQLTAIVRIELRQRLTGLRILPALLLALAPVGLLMLAGILIRINLAPGDTPSVA